jgi:hypothetical protein
LSSQVSSTPLPRHSMVRPTSFKARSMNSRTERVILRVTKVSPGSCSHD